MELKQFLQSAFNKQEFIKFISERFYGFAPNLAEDEYLGKVRLDDKSEIGFFVFEVHEHKDIENSRVGFHKELKKYADEHMLDGAIGAFYHPLQKVWRLSFIRFSYDETHKKETTSQKRFTFLLGNEKIKTAQEQLKNLKYPKIVELEKAFSVESVTKEFYKGLVKEYEKLLGEHLTYPTNSDNDKKEFAIRLIGRILFIKFLNKKVLIPDDIFLTCQDYYHEKLEPLFFEQLNTQKVERKKEFVNDSIPFLNGGLFEPLNLDFYEWNGDESRYAHILKVDDRFFSELYEHLNQFNFTIDENSIEDSDLSIDPEMLGRIFENLLAEINPETSQNARKSTGSYYTPREIVEYMVNSSLLEYIKTKTDIDEEVLKTIIFKNQEPSHDYDKTKILSAIFELKILDPACGSGAFPMGLLQRIVKILELIDEDATIWFKLQSKEFKDAHKNRNKNYIRKLSIIKNTIYGIDIQPIAIEISKLRFFLSLIVDEEGEPEPLPNLEFKFVCANSLLPKPKNNQLATLEYFMLEGDLLKLKNEYFEASGERKKVIKKEYAEMQKKMFEEEEATNLLSALENKLTDYNPFDPVSVAGFFDSDFMFNIKDGFDIVIGNPPYLRVQGIDKIESEKYKKLYKSATGSYDLYVIFTERAIKLLGKNGLVNFIMPHKWVNSAFGKGLREVAKEKFFKFISFREYQVFNASTYTSLVWFKNKSDTVRYIGLEKDLQTNSDLKAFLDSITDDKYTITKNEKLSGDAWTFSDNKIAKVLAKLDEQPLRVSDVFEKIFQGIATSKDSVYFLSECIENNEMIEGYSKELDRRISIEKELVKPALKGKDIKKYAILKTDKVIIFPYFKTIVNGKEKAELYSEKELQRLFPKGYVYLKECESVLRDRESGRLQNDEFWYRYIYPKNLTLFDKEKLITPQLSLGGQLTYDQNGEFYSDAGGYGLIKNSNIEESYKFYLAILNSKVLWFYIQNTSAVFSGGYYYYKSTYLEPFPLPKIENIEDTKPFEILVDYIIFAKSQSLEDEAKFFEWVVDVMVYGLYFTESMKKHDCYIFDEVAKLIKPFGKHDSDEFKIEYIKTLKNVMDEEKGIKRGLLFSRNVAEVEVINGEKR